MCLLGFRDTRTPPQLQLIQRILYREAVAKELEGLDVEAPSSFKNTIEALGCHQLQQVEQRLGWNDGFIDG